MNNKTEKLIKLAFSKLVYIKISADIKKIIEKLRIKSYFHPNKDRSLSNSKLINNSDVDIILNYKIIIHSLLNWFSGADNYNRIKKIVEVLRKSCAFTLKHNHKYRSLHKVYTIYGLDMKTNEAVLYFRMKILNRRKKFNIDNKQKK